MSKTYEKICIICGNSFHTSVHNKLICSKICYNKYRVIWNREHRDPPAVRYGECPVCGKKVELKSNLTVMCCSKECSKESVRISQIKYKNKNPEKAKERDLRYRNSKERKDWEKEYAERRKELGKKYQKEHREQIREYYRKRYNTKIEIKMRVALRGYVQRALTRKQQRTNEYIDFTIPELVSYIEKKFLKGMSWDNFGEWHIDHIRPLASFSFYNKDGTENIEEVKKAMRLSNLQPLWAHDNISKGAKYAPKEETI